MPDSPSTLRQGSNVDSDIAAPLSSINAVEVRGVSKRFLLNLEGVSRWSAFFWARLAAERRQQALWALQEVDLDLQRGEVLGIVGTNGSGKSTLVRIMAGISAATSGEVRRLPRVAALLDLGAGFHGSLSGYENLFLSGSIMGLSRAEIRQRLPEIIEFSGIDPRFLEVPVRYYSTGMLTRLGFSLAVSCDPDIILVDEVLAVGDAEFQGKSAKRLLEFRGAGKAMLIVSHQTGALMEFCSRIAWLNQGKIVMQGHPLDVIPKYTRYLNERKSDQRHLEESREAGDNRHSDNPEIELTTRWIGDMHGNQRRIFRLHESLTVVLEARTRGSARSARLHTRIRHETGVLVDEVLWPESIHPPLVLEAEPTEIRFTIPDLLLLRGGFELKFVLEDGESGRQLSAPLVEEIELHSDLREIPTQITHVPVEFLGAEVHPPVRLQDMRQ